MLLGNKIGRKIVRIRRERDLSQEDLAHRCNVSQAWINKIEVGKSIPSIKFLYVLSKNLNCDVFDLIPTIEEVKNYV
ncbi:helix-turn-helix domain-containing protein [Acetobacter orleanensis]|uniref:HTH cro/C1-type domain-containing protein n=1 Tax=Acetobacter orleanensis TaxID=104099 RepID=A0A4Y3TQU8_9PROT|nr:helix-turn-helix transcriptional regulator [Acetobacter orleanensis]PCD78455.1 XRE family transcriptional regulator [Acetobacter orleanensis]GAN69851.1 hypothetical protein Abol_095_002 [Acetobacter orleanensis JCM 7639]GBR22074.1 hypothetical protein AA0473_0029 [Acetobacter orleanensis NRIC 0473]GEB84158.1 hypothetical protein AOR01nite_26350 [Acetobacter orleanensis]